MPASPATCAASWPRFAASQASPWLVQRFSSPAGSRSGGADSITSISRMPVANCEASRPNWPTADVATNVTSPPTTMIAWMIAIATAAPRGIRRASRSVSGRSSAVISRPTNTEIATKCRRPRATNTR